MYPGEVTLRMTPASAPACLNAECVQGKEGGRGRSELLRVEGGRGDQEDFLEEAAAVEEEAMGEHTGLLQS